MSSLFELEEEITYVIDSNDRIREHLERLEEEQRQKALEIQEENERKVLEFYEGLEYDEEGKPIIPTDEEGYLLIPVDNEGNPLVNIDEEGNLIMDEPTDEGENPEEFEGDMSESQMSPEEIIEAANAEAQSIIDNANEQAEAIFKHAEDEGRQSGYTDGLAKGQSEYDEKYRALEAEKQNLIEEVTKARQDMEKDIVDIVCDVVERAFKVEFGESKELIMHLVDNTILNIDNSKTFLIRVSEKDHEFVLNNKESLLARLGTDVVMDIVPDPLMSEGTCMIETDGGVFNCGIDIQLEGLLRDIRLLSIEK